MDCANLIVREKDNGGPGNEIKGGKYSTGEHTIMQFFFLTGWGAIIFTLVFQGPFYQGCLGCSGIPSFLDMLYKY